VNGEHLAGTVVEVAEHLLHCNRWAVLKAAVLGEPGLDPSSRALAALILHVDLEPLLLLWLDELWLVVLVLVLGRLPGPPIGSSLGLDAIVLVAANALNLCDLVSRTMQRWGVSIRHDRFPPRRTPGE